MGAQILKEAASKTNDNAGDGTTTATILAQAIASEALNQIAKGANPMVLKKGIEKAVSTLVEELKSMSKKITSKEEIAQVATISAQDQKIGEIISETITKVGKDGVITIEEGKTTEITVEYKEGMVFDKGFASPYMVTDTDRMEASLEDPYILITDKKISSMQDLLPFLEKFVAVSKTLVIIAEEVEGEALATLILNKLRGSFNVLAVGAPGFGERRKEMLQDIAILTGSVVISDDTGRKFDSVEIEDLGRAARVTSTKDSTLIVDGKGEKAKIEDRVAQLKREIASSDSEFDKEKLQERLAKLVGGVAVINVGATTEVELKEKKERAIDALAATRSAYEEGIVPGGEIALLRVAPVLDNTKFSEEELAGVNIVKSILEKPFRKLVENAGLDADAMLEVVKKEKGNIGLDVMDGKIKDLVEAGIIDPVKVTRSALQTAASVAIMIMTTDVLVTDAKDASSPATPMAGMPGMGDY